LFRLRQRESPAEGRMNTHQPMLRLAKKHGKRQRGTIFIAQRGVAWPPFDPFSHQNVP
jgi:hypothetical protein